MISLSIISPSQRNLLTLFPRGGWWDSCGACNSLSGSVYTCQCRNGAGQYVDTSIDLSKSSPPSRETSLLLAHSRLDVCMGNDNGVLRCG